MVTQICINIGSGNGLLPDDTKPLPEPMLIADLYQRYSVAFIWGHYHKKIQRSEPISKTSLKIAFLKVHPDIPRANELEFGNKKIRYGYQAAILKVTSLKNNRLLPVAIINMHMKFECGIPKQTWLTPWTLIQYKDDILPVTSIGNPIAEIRRSYDRLISAMGFPILVRWHLYIESGPWKPCRLQMDGWTDKVNPGYPLQLFRPVGRGGYKDPVMMGTTCTGSNSETHLGRTHTKWDGKVLHNLTNEKYWKITTNTSKFTTGLDIFKYFCLPDIKKNLNADCICFTRQLNKSPLAQLARLLDPGWQAVGCHH